MVNTQQGRAEGHTHRQMILSLVECVLDHDLAVGRAEQSCGARAAAPIDRTCMPACPCRVSLLGNLIALVFQAN